MIDYKISNNKKFSYIFIIFDDFSKYTWAIPLKNKKVQTKTDEFSIFSTISKRRPVKLESDRGGEFRNSILQNFLKRKHNRHYSRFTDKGPSIAERVIRTIRNLLKKQIFLKRNSDWLNDLPSVVKIYNNTIHSSIKMTPNQASKKANEKQTFFQSSRSKS